MIDLIKKQDDMQDDATLILADTGTDIPALIATAQADLDITTGADGATLATAQALYAPNKVVPDAAGVAAALHATTDGKVDVIDAIVDRILTATEIRQAAVNDAAATTTKFITNLAEAQNDFWNRMALLFTSGNNSGQMRRIKDYIGATKEVTLQTPLDAAPANADTFIITTVRAFITPDIEDIADAVSDELTAEHTIAGSLSKAISDTLADVTGIAGDAMRGTDGANTTVPDASGVAAALHATTDGKVDVVDANVDVILVDTGTTIPGTITTLQTDSTAIKAKTDNLPSGIPKNVALSGFNLYMVLSSDHVTAATGKTVAATISKDGAAFGAATNAVAEISAGMYKIDLTQAEMNADVVTLKFTNADCDQRIITIYTS